MEARNVLSLPCIKVTDWSSLNSSRNYVTKDDVDLFVEKLYKELSAKLQISYKDLLPVLEEMNVDFRFFETLIFAENKYITKSSIFFRKLQKELNIPDISAL